MGIPMEGRFRDAGSMALGPKGFLGHGIATVQGNRPSLHQTGVLTRLRPLAEVLSPWPVPTGACLSTVLCAPRPLAFSLIYSFSLESSFPPINEAQVPTGRPSTSLRQNYLPSSQPPWFSAHRQQDRARYLPLEVQEGDGGPYPIISISPPTCHCEY